MNSISAMSLSIPQISDTLAINQSEEEGFGEKIRQALVNGWHVISDSVFAFHAIWPIIIIVTIVLILVKMRKKRIAKEKFRKNQ